MSALHKHSTTTLEEPTTSALVLPPTACVVLHEKKPCGIYIYQGNLLSIIKIMTLLKGESNVYEKGCQLEALVAIATS